MSKRVPRTYLEGRLVADEDDKAPPKGPGVGGAMWIGVKDAGAPVMRVLDMVGGHLILVGRALSWLPRRPLPHGELPGGPPSTSASAACRSCCSSARSTGMVMSLQSVYAFRQFGLESFAGWTTGKALGLELGPVLTALMLSGRAGAGIVDRARHDADLRADRRARVDGRQIRLQYLVAAADHRRDDRRADPGAAVLRDRDGWRVLRRGDRSSTLDQGQWIANLRDHRHPMDVVQGLTSERVSRLPDRADRFATRASRPPAVVAVWGSAPPRRRHGERDDARVRLLPHRHLLSLIGIGKCH